MADSDDEYDRKRRDKFRGERERSSGDYNRSDRRDDRPRGREDWAERCEKIIRFYDSKVINKFRKFFQFS